LKSFEKSQCCFDSGFNRGALPQKYQFEFLMAPSQGAIIIFKALSARLNLIHYLVDRCYLFPSGSFGMSLFCSAFGSCPIPSLLAVLFDLIELTRVLNLILILILLAVVHEIEL